MWGILPYVYYLLQKPNLKNHAIRDLNNTVCVPIYIFQQIMHSIH